MKKESVVLILLFVSIILISGCAQKECKIEGDCPEKTCFANDCIDYICSYSKLVPCPECDDKNKCTKDSFDYDKQGCVNEQIIPCCGNEICEPGETYLTCLQDCPETPKAVLEENIPKIKDYPKLEQVFIDLYADDGFSEEEIYFMQVGLETYKEKPKLKEYPREALLYLMSRIGGWDFYDAEFFNQTLIPLTEEITAGTKDDSAAVKAIYIWVNSIMTYEKGVPYDYITPKNILEKKRGACGEYSVLIAALCKAAGIPARVVHSVKILPSGLAHAWVEVYIGGDWIPIDSTGAMDYDNDGLIEYSDLVKFKNNRMVDTFIASPYYIQTHTRTDITFGYNNYIVQQMITEVQNMLKENYNLEAEENLESAKDTFSLWEKEKSTEDRHRIGRESMEYLLRAVAIIKENITGEEVQVAFLEDFPIFVHMWSTKEGKITPKLVELGDEYGDLKNPLALWEDFQETLVETNPKVLYIFDAADEEETSIGFSYKCSGIDFCMLRAIDELIKNEGLDTKLNVILYWSGDLGKIEFLEYEDIEPVVTLTKLFHDNALDFMWDFIGAVNRVKDNVTKTNFYLPPKFEKKYTYYLTAVGPFLQEDKEHFGYSIRFRMVIETRIGELPLILEIDNTPTGDGFPEYTNLIIVDESGTVFRPEKKDAKYYYPVCPSEFVNLTPGQNLIIEREGDFIKITETGKA